MLEEDMVHQKNSDIQESLNIVDYLKSVLSENANHLEKVEESLHRIGHQMKGYTVFNSRLFNIIKVTAEHTLEKTVSAIVRDMKSSSSEYELSDERNLWQEFCYLLHSEEYFYDHDFLFHLSKQFLNETEVTMYTEFSDASDTQKRFGEEVFSIIETHREKLKDYERAIIWGLEDHPDGNDWIYSEEEHDLELTWDDNFIDNHLYSLILDQAQSDEDVLKIVELNSNVIEFPTNDLLY